jgi:hypothetical protein
MKGIIPRLKDVVELTDVAASIYTKLNPQDYVGKLAPSLGLILQRDLNVASVDVSFEFLDPLAFISITHFRDAIVEALKIVNTALQSSSGAAVLSLTHAMGLGKTHFLALLYHLYVNIPYLWKEINSKYLDILDIYNILTEKAKYKVDIAEKTLVIPMDLKYIPPNLKPYEALIEFIRKVFERKREFLKREVPEKKIEEFNKLLGQLDKYEPKDAVKELCKVLMGFGVTVPVLIIIDELYAAVVEAMLGASKEYINSLQKVLIFISALIDELHGNEPAVLVYASAQQDVNRWSEIKDSKSEEWAILLRGAIKFFEDRMQRYSVGSVSDINEEEALSIVKKRVCKFKMSQHEVLSEKSLGKLRNVLGEIVGTSDAERFVRGLKETYPFSPIYKEFVRKIIVPSFSSEFTNIHHLRDLIKISSTVLSKAMEDEETYLVSIAHVEHNDIKHILDPVLEKEWWNNVMLWQKYVKEKAQELGEARMIKGAIQAIYVKSVTDNVTDLIQMLAMKPDMLQRESIERRTLHHKNLILSLVGFVNLNELGNLQRVIEELNSVPFIHVIERNDGHYYLASFVGNPLQIISNIRERELRRLKDERGELRVEEALKYISEVYQEHALLSQFKEKVPLNFEFVSLDSFESEKFLTYLNSEVFTVLIVSPISIAKKLLIDKLNFENIVKEIKNILEKNKNKIKYLNMFAVIIPYLDKSTLSKLTEYLAEIRACETALEMFNRQELLDTYIEEEMGQRKILIDFIRKRRTEEELKRLIIEVLIMLKKKLENFAQQLASTAVQNFASDFTSIFSRIITYDPTIASIKEQDIMVRVERQQQRLNDVFTSLAGWIINTVKGRLSIADSGTIKAKLIAWVENLVSQNEFVKEKLIKGESYRYNIDTIKEGLVRGWSDVPVKPISLEAIKNAIADLDGHKISTKDEKLKIIELKVEGEELVIKRFEELKLLIRLSETPKLTIKGFKISSLDSVGIFLAALEKNEWLVKNVKELYVELKVGLEVEKAEIIIKGSRAKLLDLIKFLRSYINKHRNEVMLCDAKVKLSNEVEKEEASSTLEKIGLKGYELLDKI